MTDSELLQEEITFLTDEITGLKSRMAKQDNAAQVNKLGLLTRILHREERWLKALAKRESAA